MNTFSASLAVVLFAGLCVRAETITYSYDSAGRLTGVSHGSGRSTTFHYDTTGNLLRQAATVVTDTDNDGLPDSYEQAIFQTLARDGTGDFDHDGFSDLAEYLAGTSPKDPNSLLRLHQDPVVTDLQTQVTWESVPGVTYRLQFKQSLDDPGWNDLPGDLTASGPTATKTDVYLFGDPVRFYRVQVVP